MRLVDTVIESNRQARDAWQRWAEHRMNVTGVVRALHSSQAHSLRLLGPGTMNDLDVAAVSRWFADIHLVDLDETVVARAVDDRPVGLGLHLHPSTDLSGILDCLERAATGEALERL